MSELPTRTAFANRVDHAFVARSALANAHRHARRISFLQPNPDELHDAIAAIYRAHANGTCTDAKCIAYGRVIVERRVHDDPLIPQWEERRGKPT